MERALTDKIIEYVSLITRGSVKLTREHASYIITLANDKNMREPFVQIFKYENKCYTLLRTQYIPYEDFILLSHINHKRDMQLFRIDVYDANKSLINTIYSTGTGIDYLIYKTKTK